MEELDKGWQIIKGNKRVLIVAGHNFAHGREGKIKYAEWGTGEIGRIMCDKFGFYGIISTREQMDPNWYINSPFREEIRRIVVKNKIAVIVDIHGSGMQNEELIFLRGNELFRNIFGNRLKIRGFIENEQMTLAEEFEDRIPAVEIEIREDGRIPTIDEKKFAEAQKYVEELIKLINEKT